MAEPGKELKQTNGIVRVEKETKHSSSGNMDRFTLGSTSITTHGGITYLETTRLSPYLKKRPYNDDAGSITHTGDCRRPQGAQRDNE